MKVQAPKLLAAVACALTALFVAVAEPGAADQGKPYTVRLHATPETLSTGGKATLTLTVTPQGEWRLKPETPFSAVLKPSAGLSADKTTLTAEDFESRDTSSKTVKAGLTAHQEGVQRVAIELTFFLCTDEICQRHKETAEIPLTVGG